MRLREFSSSQWLWYWLLAHEITGSILPGPYISAVHLFICFFVTDFAFFFSEESVDNKASENTGAKMKSLVLKDQLPKKSISRKNLKITDRPVHFKSIVEERNANITRFSDVTNSSTGNSVTDALLDTLEGRQEDIFQEHEMRLANLNYACANRTSMDCKNIDKCNLTEFFYSKQYNFAYCKVPKSGSTFWMKLFLVSVFSTLPSIYILILTH